MKIFSKSIIGYGGAYHVTDEGRVSSNKRGVVRWLAGSKVTGNQFVQLCLRGVPTAYRVADLVASHFIRSLSPTEVVRHRNGNTRDNRLNNLIIITTRAKK